MPPIGHNKKYTVFLIIGILINLVNIPQAVEVSRIYHYVQSLISHRGRLPVYIWEN